MSIDPDTKRMIFGFCLLAILSILAAVVALGKVEESTSHGLMPLVTALSTLAGAFSNYAFGSGRDKDGGEK